MRKMNFDEKTEDKLTRWNAVGEKRAECEELFNDWMSELTDIMESWDTAEKNTESEDIETIVRLKQKSIDKHVREFPFSEIISIIRQK